jgi:type VI secretion system secreted protein VgrG
LGKYTQDNRLIQIETPLGKDVLLLKSFAGNESISRLFSFSTELLSEDPSISFDKIVGQRVSLSVKQVNEDKRYINGFVSRFSQTGADARFTHYHAEVVPWLWFLTRSAASRIFQNMTVPDIIAKVFADLGFNDFKKSLQGTYQRWEYCVQYRETAFNFVSRLMEQEGIFYFFEHEKDKHRLVLADYPSAHKPCPGQPKATLNYTAGGLLKQDVVHDWQMAQELRTGKYSLRDYNFETPSTDLGVNEPSAITVNRNTKYEIYDYPGEYSKRADGQTVAKTRMQEEETTNLLATGSSDCRGFVSGFRFDLDGHSRKDMNQSYVLTEVNHSATVGDSYTNESASSGENYFNHFSCIPDVVPFRPTRLTPKPFVQGPQTAVVVGKSGEEIWVDKYGRVKVQFFWDREGKKDENSSCWVRVSQPWAGKNWGAIWIPRIGQEVIVDFLEGDPDQPIITGRVYNAEQMPPYALPDNQTRSTYMSRSSQGGSSSTYNELRFEDKMGSEQIFINAEKDMDVRIENQSREFIGDDRSLIVTANQREQVKADKHGHVQGDHFEKIDGDMSLQVGKKQMEKIGSDQSIEVDGDQKEKVVGTVSLQVGKDQKEKIGGSVSLQVGEGRDEKIGTSHAMEAGQTIHLKGGMTVIIEAGMQLSLKAAGGFVDIGPAGVTISGTMVLINSGGAAGSAPDASPQSPDSPDAPTDPKDPDIADDGTKGGMLSS